MRIEKIINDAITLTQRTGIPLLFLSNPGFGKTTILKRYAKNHGFHLETLIGSRFSPEEISGYQVNNGGDHLTHMSPEWYSRIMAKSKEGIKSLLFIDELSTCSEAVQGALLSLIFDRTIGSEKFLPEDCVIVSAANYSQNLPAVMNIMAPTLNRFILINLNENYKAMDLIDEFINEEDKNDDEKSQRYIDESLKVEEAPFYPLSDELKKAFFLNYKTLWQELFQKYSDPQSSQGILDISNMELDGLYNDSENYIYNFISGRTISYLYKTLLAYVELRIKNKDLLEKIIDGLIGSGTCSFVDEVQAKNFRKFIHTTFSSLINLDIFSDSKVIPLCHDIVKDVQSYILNCENLMFSIEERVVQAEQIFEDIKKQFKIENVIKLLQDKDEIKITKFTCCEEAIIEFQKHISLYNQSYNISSAVTKIAMDYYGLYCEIVNITPDFTKTFGCTNKLFDKVVFLEKKDSKGRENYARAVLRKPGRGELASLNLLNDDEESFIAAKLRNIVHDSDYFNVICWKDGLKKVPTYDYVRKFCKSKAA